VTKKAIVESTFAWKKPVIDILNDPPLTPVAGQRYLVGPAPTGVWGPYANYFMIFTTVWEYTAPRQNDVVRVGNDDVYYIYDLSVWKLFDTKLKTIRGIPVPAAVAGDDLKSLVYDHASTSYVFKKLGDDWSEYTNEITGFVNQTDSVISFVGGVTRTFTIQPNSPATEFDYFHKNVKYNIDSADTVISSDIEGKWYFYYDGGTLTASQTEPEYKLYCNVAEGYWDSTNKVMNTLVRQKHEIIMDSATHKRFHNIGGAKLQSGFTAGNYNLSGDGSVNTHAQLGISDGIFWDDDLQYTIINNTPQQISTVLQLPMLYLDSASANLRKDSATDYPIKQGTATIQYNLNTGGTWSTTDVTDGYFVAVHVFVHADISEPLLGLLGQAQSPNLSAAIEDNKLGNVIYPVGVSTNDCVYLYTLVFQADSNFTNTPKARLAAILPSSEIAVDLLEYLKNLTLTWSISSCLFQSNASYVDNNSTSFQSAAVFLFPGTDHKNISIFQAVLSGSTTAGTVQARIVDLSNGNAVVADITVPNSGHGTTPTLYEDSILENLPSTSAIFELQIRKTTTGGAIRMHYFVMS